MKKVSLIILLLTISASTFAKTTHEYQAILEGENPYTNALKERDLDRDLEKRTISDLFLRQLGKNPETTYNDLEPHRRAQKIMTRLRKRKAEREKSAPVLNIGGNAKARAMAKKSAASSVNATDLMQYGDDSLINSLKARRENYAHNISKKHSDLAEKQKVENPKLNRKFFPVFNPRLETISEKAEEETVN